MSSFIVEDKTINRIVKGLTQLDPDYSMFIGTIWPQINTAQDLAQQLLDFNLEAVGVRYNEREKASHKVALKNIPPVTAKEFSFVLNCYLYQCSEGNVLDCQFMQQLTLIAQVLLMAKLYKHMSNEEIAEYWV